MRWLLLKDLQILRRSPLQAVLLVAYPVLIALLVGFAISRDPEKPRVAFLNEVPAGTPGQRRRAASCRRSASATGSARGSSACGSKSRDEAIEEVRVRRRAGGADPARRSGRPDQLALDPRPRERRRSKCSSTRRTRSRRRLVDDRIDALLAQANLVIARRIADRRRQIPRAASIDGGEFDVLGKPIEILGLQRPRAILEALRPALPPGALRELARPGDPLRHPGPRQPRRRRGR